MKKHRPYNRLVKIVLLSVFAVSAIALSGYITSVIKPWATQTTVVGASQSREKTFTIVAIPDTQYYSQTYHDSFGKQTAWIAQNKEARNIVFVTHLGDIVEHGNDESQWKIASKAMEPLDGIIRYGIAPGNHDYDSEDAAAGLYDKYFPLSRIAGGAEYTSPSASLTRASDANFGAYDSQNIYHLLTIGNRKLLAFNLEYCPSNEVLRWSDAVLKQHASTQAIITTHSFLDYKFERVTGETCPIYASTSSRNGGVEMWNKLVAEGKNSNIMLFLNGHDIWSQHGATRRTDVVNGRPVHQLMSDYQMMAGGGSGYLRLMTFDFASNKLKVQTYSPILDKYLTDLQNDFTLQL